VLTQRKREQSSPQSIHLKAAIGTFWFGLALIFSICLGLYFLLHFVRRRNAARLEDDLELQSKKTL
jgi:hypothetical protein